MPSTTTMERRMAEIKRELINNDDPVTRQALVQELSSLSSNLSNSSYHMGYENGYQDAHRFVPSGI